MIKLERLARNNIILLVCLLTLILFYPLFESDKSLIRDLLLTGVFFSGVCSLEFSARSRMVLVPLAIRWLLKNLPASIRQDIERRANGKTNGSATDVVNAPR